ncbi:hypothetical protein LSAT2_000653 [Lamellibrachia satsuma]|nr:hypothetical protein LSAT2_000653 [Lamellibrachia satsuma]
MRASVVLLFVFLALTFVAAHPAVEEEADDPSLSMNSDSDEASFDGVRVKRAYGKPKPLPGYKKLSPKGRGTTAQQCHCLSRGNSQCQWIWYGCRCRSTSKQLGGCQTYIRANGGWNECTAQGPQNSRCECHYKPKKYVKCRAPQH